ncbi:MAG: hypothetical protein WCL39_06315, partial [Armatimonadota bacterium]
YGGFYDILNNKLFLANDAGSGWLGGFAPGSANVIENSFYKLYCAETTTSANGNNRVINWRIEPKASMAGKTVKGFVLCSDRYGLADGWDNLASYSVANVVAVVNTAPVNVGMTPASGTLPLAKTTLTTTHSDAQGAADITRCFLILNPTAVLASGYGGFYDILNNKLFLANDAGSGWLGGFAPGSANVIENSSYKLYCAETTTSASGNNRVINWRLEPKAAVAGKAVDGFTRCSDKAGLADGWDKVGSFTVAKPAAVANTAPTNVIVAPVSGTLKAGVDVLISTIASDPQSASNLSNMWLVINTSLSLTKCIYVCFDANTNLLFLRDDNDTTWLGGYAPGSASTIENSSCIVRCAKTTFGLSGANLRVNWSICPKSSMAGKTVKAWLYSRDDGGLVDEWDLLANYLISP